MASNNFDKYTNSPEFKELLENYESSANSGGLVYFECDDLIDIAEYYHKNGELEKAENAALYCRKLYPEEAAPLLFRARMALIDHQDVEKAKAIMADLREEEESIDSVYVKAEIMLTEGDAHATEEYLQEKYAQFSDSRNNTGGMNDDEEEEENAEDAPDFALDIAMMYCDHFYFELSERWLKKARVPEDDLAFEYYDTWSRILIASGRLEEAIDTLNKQIDIDSFNVSVWLMLSDIQYQLARYQDALQSAEYAMAIAPKDAYPYLTRGNSLYAMNRLEEAEQCFERYAELAPEEVGADLLLATTKFCRKDNDGAYAHAKKVYQNIDRFPPFQQAEALRTCATIAAKVADMGLADQCCEYMQKLGLPEEEIEIMKGSICMEVMDLQRAVAHFNKALTQTDYDSKVVARIGIICYETGSVPYAYHLLKEVVDIEEENDYENVPPRSLAFLAGACRVLSKREEYLHYLEYAVKIMPLEASSVLGDYFPLGTEPSQYLEIEKKRMGESGQSE